MALTWLFFALLPPAIWAAMNIIEKHIAYNILRKPLTYTIISMIIMNFIGFIIIVPVTGLRLPSSIFITILALLSGMTFFAGVYPYLNALTFEEVSRVIPIWQTIPLFIVIMEILFLKKILSINHYIALILLVAGGILISIKKTNGIFKITKAFWLMLLSSFIFAIGAIITKYVLTHHTFWDSYLLFRIGGFIPAACFLLHKPTRNTVLKTVKSLKPKIKITLVSLELFDIIGNLLYNFAVFLAPVSLVSAIGGFQPLFLLIFAVFISIWIPKILKEEVNKKVLLTKAFAITLMFAGLYFLYLK